MKILVIGDIHGRKFWRKAIANNSDKVDKIVFLGDYLDPYPEEIEENPESMECNSFYDSDNLLKMLEDIVELKKNNPNKYVLLCGNHTCSYIWNNFAAATRTDRRNYNKYHKFFMNNLNLFQLVHIEGDIIFSHAGITPFWAKEFCNGSVKQAALILENTSLEDFDNIECLSNTGLRGAYGGDGSCEWADLREHINMFETQKQHKIVPFSNEDDIYQIFGHTQVKEPLITDKFACVDCRKGFIVDKHEITEC